MTERKTVEQEFRLMELGIIHWPFHAVNPTGEEMYKRYWPPTGLAARVPYTIPRLGLLVD